MNLAGKVELGFIVFNILVNLPFLGNWWMTPPQLVFALMKLLWYGMGKTRIEEKDTYHKSIYLKHRRHQ